VSLIAQAAAESGPEAEEKVASNVKSAMQGVIYIAHSDAINFFKCC
jgi:hypothetical protein